MEMGVPYMQYDSITILYDGPGNTPQITLSVGATEMGGNLKKIVDLYISKNGKYSKDFIPYSDRIGKKPSLVDDKKFIDLLKTSSREDPLMREAQDEIYESAYLQSGIDWGKANGFTHPLSYLVIIDSFLHSGRIFMFLRNKFSEKTPANGGDEKDWITAYVEARHNWLRTHSNKAVRNSSYRTKDYLRYIADNNWNLKNPVVANGVKIT